MTYHLAAFRLHSIGERSARFTDVTLDLTGPDGDSSHPADSVIWLRNGGGKSSLLSLFYALLLPRAVDFMGRTVKRSLTDYVDSGDTAHTVAAWHPSTSDTLDGSPDRVLITGVVYEWCDLRRPADADRARDRLDTTFYAFYAVPGVLDLHALPILDATNAPRRRAAYVAALKEYAATYPQAMDLVATEKQHEWTTALTSRGLDPALFRTQKQMNHVEGGVEDMFRFSSAREFIDLLIDLTVAPEDAISVAERLASIASLLATKPAKTAERDFCLDSATGLDRTHVCQQEVDASALAVQQAADEAARLSATFAAAVTQANNQIEVLAAQRDAIEKRRAAAVTEGGAAYELVYLYEERAAQIRLGTAQDELSKADTAVSDAAELIAAWEAAGHLAEKKELQDALERTRREAGEERERTAPMRHEHDEHTARLRTRLLTLVDAHETTVAMATKAATKARADVEAHRAAAKKAGQDAQAADKEAATATAHLGELDADLRTAVRDGVLPSEQTDPTEHDAVLAEQHATLAGILDEIQSRREQRPALRRALTDTLATLAGEHVRLDGERARLVEERTAFAERASTLVARGRVQDLTESTGEAPADLWAEADTLTRRLSDAIVGTDVALVRLEAERVDDQRILDVHARTGLLPTTLDAEQVQAILAEHSVMAETGWAHLRTLLPGTRLLETVTDPDLARLGVGLVIPTAQADAAASVLAGVDTATTALVGVYTAQAAAAIVGSPSTDPGIVAPVWTALHRGLVDPAWAEGAVRQVTTRAEAYEEQQGRLAEARETDRALLRELTDLLSDCPAGHLDSLSGRIDDLDNTLLKVAAALEQARTDLAELDEAEAKDASIAQQIQRQISDIEKFRSRLSSLIHKMEAAVSWRSELAEAESRAKDAHDLAVRHAENADRALDDATEQSRIADVEGRTANTYRSEAAGLAFLDSAPDVTDDPAVSLDVLRARRQEAERAWQVQASQSVLAERERTLAASLASHEQALTAVSAETCEHASALLSTAEGQTKPARAVALAAARGAEKEAVSREARAAGDIEQHSATLKRIRARRTDPPKRALPVEPTTAEQADNLAAEYDGIGQACVERRTIAEGEIRDLEGKQGEYRSRATAFELLADGLPDPADQVIAPFAGSEDEAKIHKQAVMAALRGAEKRASDAAVSRANAVGDLRTTGSRYPGVATPAKDRVLHDNEEVLAEHAGTLAKQLRLRADMINGELADIAEDQSIVTGSLARLVSNTLDTLRKAERYSRVATKTGGWAGKQMLRIAFEPPASDADLRTYVTRVVERRIADGVKPEGLPLLKDAVHEAAGIRGFTVKVLKPALDLVPTTEDITRLGKWSGGEKLTVCVALYCTIAALRAVNAGRRDRSGGVLLLDNPIGRASHGSLVGLQRAVAAAHKVQLVYTTGVKDPDAVSRFPNVIRLDNRPGRTRNRRYIVPDGTLADASDQRLITGVRVAHDESPSGAGNHAPTDALT
ncbi:hypothetical protein Ssi03_08490 [Sphaerisporangium siamense]|uniref:Chromosome segregation ATPase n=1 Tax=Sphaerisporangium siamense TaxID=795645 RepID=A0A7W7DGW9_9ACTN|nr:hypothetical protein [Sphaerisporangium siamense]MBB4705755.1 hypothetical protein [Sphaerisporangium siamense]GII82859.1 hypothetical protein Ssi03_08490 [Sphaerisporangium siamense]